MNKPPYTRYPKIASEALLLRKIEPEDLPELLPISFYDGKQAETEAEAAKMLQQIEQDYLSGESLHWGIEERSSGKLTGTCGFYRGFKNASGELGSVLLPEYRGKGYMTEAMRLAIDYGFRRIGLKRIFAVTSKDNSAAIRLMERLNFSRTKETKEEVKYEIFPRHNLLK